MPLFEVSYTPSDDEAVSIAIRSVQAEKFEDVIKVFIETKEGLEWLQQTLSVDECYEFKCPCCSQMTYITNQTLTMECTAYCTICKEKMIIHPADCTNCAARLQCMGLPILSVAHIKHSGQIVEQEDET